jgi:hypothetical protein
MVLIAPQIMIWFKKIKYIFCINQPNLKHLFCALFGNDNLWIIKRYIKHQKLSYHVDSDVNAKTLFHLLVLKL